MELYVKALVCLDRYTTNEEGETADSGSEVLFVTEYVSTDPARAVEDIKAICRNQGLIPYDADADDGYLCIWVDGDKGKDWYEQGAIRLELPPETAAVVIETYKAE